MIRISYLSIQNMLLEIMREETCNVQQIKPSRKCLCLTKVMELVVKMDYTEKNLLGGIGIFDLLGAMAVTLQIEGEEGKGGVVSLRIKCLEE